MIKKLVIVFVFLSSFAYSEPCGVFKIGRDYSGQYCFTGIEFGYNFDVWKISIVPYGSLLTWSEVQGGFKYAPFREIYSAGMKIKYDRFTVRAEHYCNHPVYSGSRSISWYSPYWIDALNTISLEIEF